MSQNDFIISDANGATVLADINSAFQALASQSSAATEPATKYAYQPWYDTSTGLLKFRNAANNAWVTFGPVADATKVELYVNNSKAFDISSALVHTFAGTAAAKLPVGTTAQRPTAVQGMIRYNTSLSLFEGYDGTAWGTFGAPADGSITYVKLAAAAIATSAEVIAGTASKVAPAAALAPLFYGCSLYQTTGTVLTISTWVTLLFDTELYDDDGWHSTVTNTGRITTNFTGRINLIGTVNYGAAASAIYALRLLKNGTTFRYGDIGNAVGGLGNMIKQVTADVNCAPGDYFELQAYTNNASPTSGTGIDATSFTAKRIK